jgi:hypothetical protein
MYPLFGFFSEEAVKAKETWPASRSRADSLTPRWPMPGRSSNPAAGFEFVGASEVNQNPADQPSTSDVVWRLPPNFVTARGDEAVRAQMSAIGESNRMTLKFRGPE